MAAVIIGVDPHKGSRTAVATGGSEKRLGRLRVPAAGDQAGTLLEQSASWPDRTWAVEGAGGLGHLLDWQLVAAGEKVLDIQPKLGSRVRLLSSGSANKNDPNDAFSVAVAALRSPVRRVVRPEDHTTALKLQCKRYQDLSRLRNQAACRLHALLCGLVPGGIATEITTARATEVPRNRPPGQPRRPSAAPARHRPRRRHAPPGPAAPRHPRRARRRGQGLRTPVLAGIYGIGPVIAAIVIGDVEDITRFATRDSFASYDGTAPTWGVLRAAGRAPAVPARQPAPEPRHPAWSP